jgi:hypothetical protein
MADGNPSHSSRRAANWLTIGAFISAGIIPAAPASDATPAPDGPEPRVIGHGSVVVKEVDGRLFFAEGGGPLRAIPFADAASATGLRDLLRAAAPNGGAASADVGRTVVADGASDSHRTRDGK